MNSHKVLARTAARYAELCEAREAPAPEVPKSRPDLAQVLVSKWAKRASAGDMAAFSPRVTEMVCASPEAVTAAGMIPIGGGEYRSGKLEGHVVTAHYVWELRPEDDGSWCLLRKHEERLPDFRTAKTAQIEVRIPDTQDITETAEIIQEGLAGGYEAAQIFEMLCEICEEVGVEPKTCIMQAALQVGAEAQGVFELCRRMDTSEPDETATDDEVALVETLLQAAKLKGAERRIWAARLPSLPAFGIVLREVARGREKYGRRMNRLARAILASTGLDLSGSGALCMLAQQMGLEADLEPEDAAEFADAHNVMHGEPPETGFGAIVDKHAQASSLKTHKRRLEQRIDKTLTTLSQMIDRGYDEDILVKALGAVNLAQDLTEGANLTGLAYARGALDKADRFLEAAYETGIASENVPVHDDEIMDPLHDLEIEDDGLTLDL